jgi:excinuclease UvrABC ATPase subunit
MPLVPLWIKALIVAALLAATTIYVNRYLSSVEQRGYDRAVTEYQAKTIKAQDDAIIESNRRIKLVEDAINRRNDREKSIRAVADAAGVAVGGLRNELDAARTGMSVADAATLRHAATTYSVIFGECAERYTGLAEKATRHVSDIQTLMEAGAK